MISRRIDIDWLKEQVEYGDFIALARALTLVENDIHPSGDLLKKLNINRKIPVIGVTGIPIRTIDAA
ncbi:MAG: hypothetical protein EOO85_14910 [Pedobacter sp.]|nr:MAG: hypothetical protein EOO85_14910 [Pedobacter sp.]